MIFLVKEFSVLTCGGIIYIYIQIIYIHVDLVGLMVSIILVSSDLKKKGNSPLLTYYNH